MAQQLTPLQAMAASGWLVIAGIVIFIIAPNSVREIGVAHILLAVVLALFATGHMRRLLRRRLQGYTGDGLGATQQLSEVAIYAGLAATLPLI